MFKTALAWLVVSSKNPQQVSMTLSGIITLIVSASVFFGHPVQQSYVSDVVTDFFLFIQQATAVVGTAMTLYGAARKIVLTLMGKNQAIIALQAAK